MLPDCLKSPCLGGPVVLPGLGLTPGNLGRRDPPAGGAPTCIPRSTVGTWVDYTWLCRRNTVDGRLETGVGGCVRASYVDGC